MRFSGPVSEQFEREYGCSISEWMQWLPVAAGGNRLTVDAGDAGGGLDGKARIELMRPASAHSGRLEGSGETTRESASESALGTNSQPVLVIAWKPLEPRRIALLSISRLRVRFEFSATTESQRQEFMRHFDLTMQRGGG